MANCIIAQSGGPTSVINSSVVGLLHANKELGAFYVAALNMKSVLLAAALVKGKINANQAFEAAFLEELWQNENWGADEEALKKREELKQELVDVENFLK